MKKIALTLLMSGAAALGCPNASMAVQVSHTDATGDLIVRGSCTPTIALAEAVALLDESKAQDGAHFNTATISNTCDGQLWIGAVSQDETGHGLMLSTNGQHQAGFELEKPSGWSLKENNAAKVLVSDSVITGGTPVQLKLLLTTKGSAGLPKQGIRYRYQVEGGQWVD